MIRSSLRVRVKSYTYCIVKGLAKNINDKTIVTALRPVVTGTQIITELDESNYDNNIADACVHSPPSLKQKRALEKKTATAKRTSNNNFARASRFFVHFFTVLARLRRENA